MKINKILIENVNHNIIKAPSFNLYKIHRNNWLVLKLYKNRKKYIVRHAGRYPLQYSNILYKIWVLV